MKSATSSGVTRGGHANGKVRAARSASSGTSASTAVLTSTGMPGVLEIPLREMCARHLVEQYDVGDGIAIRVPPHVAGDGRSRRSVLQRVLKGVWRIGVA